MADERKMAAFRFSAPTAAKLAALSDRWSADKTGVLEHGVALLANPELAAVLGGQFMSAEQGLRCWAEVIAGASAENDNLFTRAEWNLIADANNGCSPVMTLAGEDMRLSMPTTLLWANVADDIKLNGGDKKWKVKDARGLVDRLRGLDFVHAWAVVLAVQWFWEHAQCAIDHQADEWWTVDFRRAHRCAEE